MQAQLMTRSCQQRLKSLRRFNPIEYLYNKEPFPETEGAFCYLVIIPVLHVALSHQGQLKQEFQQKKIMPAITPMIRLHTSSDRPYLLALLQLNTPRYFAPEEENDFIEYLEHHSQNYLVVEHSGRIIGAGGFNTGFDNGRTVRISWDIIHPDFQGKGIGTGLTLYRIEQIKKITGVTKIVVRTSQLACDFYQKMGFELESIEKDFWAKGFDLYQMKLMV